MPYHSIPNSADLVLLLPSKRHRSRPPSDQIAFGVRSDCVRRPIGLRTSADDFAKELL